MRSSRLLWSTAGVSSAVALQAVVLQVVGGCAGSEAPQGGPVEACGSAADCAARSATGGMLCLGGVCQGCTATWQCRQVPAYGVETACVEGRCVTPAAPDPATCTAGRLGCRCGEGCEAGLVCDAGAATCRPARTCAEVSCGAGNACVPPADGGDARCVPGCEAGLTWLVGVERCGEVGGSCGAAGAGGIGAACAALGRTCVEGTGAAYCDACLTGRVERGNACVVPPSCAGLGCHALGRACESPESGACGGCLAGHVDAGDGVRCWPRCAALACPAGSECVEQSAAGPARCVVEVAGCGRVPVCGAGEAWDPHRGECVGCAAAGCVSDAARTGRVFPLTSGQGRCVCETRAGYYFDHGANRAEPCDADGDGWVRRGAWPALQAKPASGCGGELTSPGCDCAVRANARCELRRIDAVVLHTVDGSALTVGLGADPLVGPLLAGEALELYEVDGNDDLTRRVATGLAPLPLYRHALASGEPPARGLAAAELHSLTKACVDARADFNGNGQRDLTEYQGMEPGETPGWLRPFTHLAYFVELAEGWYEAPAAGAGGAGKYHIAERGRRAGEGGGVPLVPMMRGDTSHASGCARLTDADYTPSPSAERPNTGMDFARFNPSSAELGPYREPTAAHFADWLGHHGQFKCVELVAAAGARDPAAARRAPHELALGEVGGELFGCWLGEGTPLAEAMVCEPVAATVPDAGAVGWQVVGYEHYTGAAGSAYRRGCVNECLEAENLPEPRSCGATQDCVPRVDDFGKHACACKETHTGAECATPCGHWFVDEDGDGYARQGTIQPRRCAPPPGATSPPWRYTGDAVAAPVGECSATSDTDAAVHTGARDVCDGKDNDCDGTVDEDWLPGCTAGTNPCQVTPACTAGRCTYSARVCNDDNACTTDGCDAATGCTFTPIACNDGKSCTADACDPAAGCRYSSTCGATGNECTYSECTASGCQVRNRTDGSVCGRPCYADRCRAGQCVQGGSTCPVCSPCGGYCCSPCAGGGCSPGQCVSDQASCP